MTFRRVPKRVMLVFVYVIVSVKDSSVQCCPNLSNAQTETSFQSIPILVKRTQEIYSVNHQSLAVDVDNSGSWKLIHEELQSLLKDFKEQKNSVAVKLDYLVTKMEATEKELKNSCANTESVGTCLKWKKCVGVYYKHSKGYFKNQTYPKNCKEVQLNGNAKSGIYEIYPSNAKAPFPVLCDMEIRGGGWTHIHKRFDGSQDFGLKWRDYKFGFGDLEGEFWLGLQNIYLLTGFESAELLVEIVDRDNITGYAHYTSFAIGPEQEAYPLSKLSGFSGDAKDALAHHLGQKFSTIDLDFSDNCAGLYRAGWWYKQCFWSNLNGQHLNIDLGVKYKYQGLQWDTWRYTGYCHSKARMLVRPVN